MATSTDIVVKSEIERRFCLTNDSDENIYLAMSNDPDIQPTAVLNSGIRLNPWEKFYSWPNEIWTGNISAISASGAANLCKVVQ